MSRSVEEIVKSCRETKEEMSLSDFRICVDAVYIRIGQAFRHAEEAEMPNCMEAAADMCSEISSCFLDEECNLSRWFLGEKCSFVHPVTRKTVEIKVRDNYAAIYYFLKYCMRLKKREKMDETFVDFVAFILSESDSE